MFISKVLLLSILLLQIGSVSHVNSLSYNDSRSSGMSNITSKSSNILTINDVLHLLSFPPNPLKINTSKDLTIAIIDSGINKSVIPDHWINKGEIPNNSIDDDHNGYVDDYYGFDFVLNQSIAYSGNYSNHGTFVANIIAKMVGNYSNIHIMDIRVLNSDNKNTNYNAFANAINYALKFPSVKVIQFSIEFLNSIYSNYPPLLHWVFTKAFLRHVAIVTVSGNDEKNQISDPGSWAETIAVTSADYVLNKWYKSNFANYGSNIDVSVPGTNIQSIGSNGLPLIESGTSFSAAFVGGTIALLDAMYPSRNMSVQTIRSLLQSSAENLYNCNQFGAGLLNVTQLIQLANLSNYSQYSPVCNATYSIPISLGPEPTTKALNFPYFSILVFFALVVKRKYRTRKLKNL